MAFSLRKLSVLAYANGFTLWLYKAGKDERAETSNATFFGAAGDMLASGDMVMVSSPSGGQMMCVVSDRSGIRTAPLG